MIKNIDEEKIFALRENSPANLADNPNITQGYTAQELKEKFVSFVLDTENSVVAEINRVVDEVNGEIEGVDGVEGIKGKVTAVEAKVNDVEAGFEAVKSSVGTLSNEVTTVKDKVTTVETDVNTVKTSILDKQDKLIAGDNITINGNTISALNCNVDDKQDKLIAGENIIIDENNMISAKGGGAEKIVLMEGRIAENDASIYKERMLDTEFFAPLWRFKLEIDVNTLAKGDLINVYMESPEYLSFTSPTAPRVSTKDKYKFTYKVLDIQKIKIDDSFSESILYFETPASYLDMCAMVASRDTNTSYGKLKLDASEFYGFCEFGGIDIYGPTRSFYQELEDKGMPADEILALKDFLPDSESPYLMITSKGYKSITKRYSHLSSYVSPYNYYSQYGSIYSAIARMYGGYPFEEGYLSSVGFPENSSAPKPTELPPHLMNFFTRIELVKK